MIALTFALPTESSGIARFLRKNQSAPDQSVIVFHTGVGARTCRQRLEDFLQKQPVDMMVSSGFAGALTNDLSPGDIFIAENFSEPDLIPRTQKTLDRFHPCVGKLASAPEIIGDTLMREELAESSGASAVDMETATIFEICQRHGIPLLSLRVISDTPESPFPLPSNLLFNIERQKTELLVLTRYLLRRPGTIPSLISFARQISLAKANLTAALVELLRSDFV